MVCSNEHPLLSFYNKLIEIFNNEFPIVPIKSRTKKPWITEGLRVSSNNMRCLHTLSKFSPNNASFITYFNKYRQIYRRVVKSAKDKYFGDRLESADNKQKEVWRIVNSLRGKNNPKNLNSHLDANTLNSFYCSIASKLGRNIPAISADPLSFLQNMSSDSFYFMPATAEEIVEIFRDIKNKGSTGWDNISMKVLERLPLTALATLANCINSSFSRGEFPDLLQKAIVIPIFKRGEDAASNDRPILLLPSLSKVAEKVLEKRMINFLETKHVLNMFQFGFQNSKNTSDAIFHMLEKLYLGINNGEAAAVVFCDLAKAFESSLNATIARDAYFTLIDSHLRYGVCFWGNSSAFLLDSLFVLQKRALRYLCGLGYRESCKSFFISQHILTLPAIFILETVCLMHRKYSFIIHSPNLNNTRSSYIINLPIPTSTLTQNSIFYRRYSIIFHYRFRR